MFVLNPDPSHELTSIGVPDLLDRVCLRFRLVAEQVDGPYFCFVDEANVSRAVEILAAILDELQFVG